MEFNGDESVKIKTISLNEKDKTSLNENLILFYTGKHRKSTEIHRNQARETKDKVELYKRMRDISHQMYDSLSKGDIKKTGKFLHENWLLKKQLTNGISNDEIDKLYEMGIREGAEGGKLIGAGGSGFLMFYSEKEKHTNISKVIGLKSEEFRFEDTGSKIIRMSE